MHDSTTLTSICLALLATTSATFAKAEQYEPDWATIQPSRTLRIAADDQASDTENGQRVRGAIDKLRPGDRLMIGPGTYSVARLWDLEISGDADAPIWIVADEDAVVRITRPDARQNVLNVGQREPVQYLCLRGLEFFGGSHGIRLGQCKNVWIDRCHIHHTGEVCLSANSADTHRIYLTRNTIHDGGGTAEGMYLGGNHGSVVMSESVIAMNHVYNCAGSQGDGIELKQGSWGNLIARNTVHDCKYPCITVYGTAGKRQNIIERNICYRSRDSVMQVQGEAIVRNNLLIAGQGTGFNSTDHQGKTTRLQVIHNTIINTSRGFRGGSWNSREGMVLANNVIYSRDRDALHFPGGHRGVEIHGNILLGGGNAFGSGQGRGLEDFRDLTWDAERRDATPTDNAPFHQGDERFQLKTDLNGNPRDQPSVIAGAVTR